MPVAAGSRLGPYEIQSLIGAGGMGEVYRAKDTRLDRTVAIKVLPLDVASDPDRRTRFDREARAISSLTHPYICSLYDVGEQDGTPFLVMELLEGETLAERLVRGRLPLTQSLEVAAQIAEALAAAHKHGIIHRDLKPGNVMLTKSGVKLLDFGLASWRGHEAQPVPASLLSAPTRAGPLTAQGTIVGTLQYMAPEQIEARDIDARTDLFAFGAIVYEMVTGQRAFQTDSSASLIAAILEHEPPPLTATTPLAPPALDRLVRRCLAKDPDERWDTAHDVADELRWMQGTSGVGTPTIARAQGRRQLTMVALPIAAFVAGGVLVASLTYLLRPVARPLVTRTELPVSPAERFGTARRRTAMAWTPDGQALVFVGSQAVQQLYVRRLAATDAVPLAGTEGAEAPAVSADGQWVAFWANGLIKKVPLAGGPVMDVAPVKDVASDFGSPPSRLVWDDRGRLFFGEVFGPIWMIPTDGPATALTTVGEGELFHALPWPLPGGRVVLYTVRKRQFSWGDEEVVAYTLATRARKVLLKDAIDARYVPTGHLVFLRRGSLYAVAFDAGRLEVHGTPIPVLDGVAQALTGFGNNITGAGQFAIAVTGALAWVPSATDPYAPNGQLVMVDGQGHVTPLPADPHTLFSPVRVSPDGRRLAVTVSSPTEVGPWLYDLDRNTLTRLPGNGEAIFPVWSPDGQHLVTNWLVDGRWSLAMQPADGKTPPVVLVRSGELYPGSFRPDGRQLAVSRRNIMLLTVEPGRTGIEPLIAGPQRQHSPEFSPDGRWLAYCSDVTGRVEVYVRPYPGQGPAELVSVEGGNSPAWHPNGRRLFYDSLPDSGGKRSLMAADFSPSSPPRIGRPRVLFEIPRNTTFAGTPARSYDVARDGQHFYAVQWTPARPPAVTHINLVTNWVEELKAKVPVK